MAKIYRVIQIKLDQFGLSKCSYYHRLTNKAYLSAVTVTNISRSFYLQDGGRNQLAFMEQDYVAVTLYCMLRIAGQPS